jgi:hypothetical protein
MKAHEDIKVSGRLQIRVFDENGTLKDERDLNNLVVTAGKGFIASRMVGTASPVMSHMAIGSNSTAPVVGDTALGGELGRASLTSGTATGAVATYIATFNAGIGSGAVTEAGILNSGTGGTMLCRTVFPVVNKGASDTMTVTWTVTIS